MNRPVLVVAAALLALGGCSQVAALAPVGGDAITEVRFAANDILVQKSVDILIAPVCTLAELDITCAGTTVQGDAIAVTSTSADDAEMTVLVAGKTIYHGSVQAVLDASARPSS